MYVITDGTSIHAIQTWEECQPYLAAKYVSFYQVDNKQELERALAVFTAALNIKAAPANESAANNTRDKNVSISLYTDGSYKNSVIGGGFVAVKSGKEIYRLKCPEVKGEDSSQAEVYAVVQALTWAVDQGLQSVVIRHDFNGIVSFLTKKKSIEPYMAEYQRFIADIRGRISISFKKIKSDNAWHKIAHSLAYVGSN